MSTSTTTVSWAGVPGAYRVYELDYWGTSYREAIEVVNQVAPDGATVEVTGPWRIATPFARKDLRVVRLGIELPADAQPTTYFLSLTRRNMDAGFASDASTIAEIQVLGATLAIVKSISPR